MSAAHDAVGARFGRLVVSEVDTSRTKSGCYAYVVCLCDCGNTKSLYYYDLPPGRVNSCGCLHRDQLATRNRTHGASGTKEYLAWKNMISRCESPSADFYADYGGRGISVCAEWRVSFTAFLDYVGAAPSPHHSLERRLVDGNYEPGNVRWATAQEQSRNKRNNRHYTYLGRTQCISDWAVEIGVERQTLATRLNRGWSVARALTTLTRAQQRARDGFRLEDWSDEEKRRKAILALRSAIQRCHNPNNRAYSEYGGRGIRVCEDWQENFDSFYAHIGPPPTPAHSLDRRRVHGGYFPGNVRWATYVEQRNNMQRNSPPFIRRKKPAP